LYLEYNDQSLRVIHTPASVTTAHGAANFQLRIKDNSVFKSSPDTLSAPNAPTEDIVQTRKPDLMLKF
jgi:hypothetical protein